jgi:hypothetical protein
MEKGRPILSYPPPKHPPPKLRISFKHTKTGDCGTTILDEGKITQDPELLSPMEAHKPLEIKTLTNIKSRNTLNEFNREDSAGRRLSRPIILTKTPSIQTKIFDQRVEQASGTPSNSHLVDKVKSSTTCVWPHSLPGPEMKYHNFFLDK